MPCFKCFAQLSQCPVDELGLVPCEVEHWARKEKGVSIVARVLAIHPSLLVPVNRHLMGALCVPAMGGFTLGKFFYFLDLCSQSG